MYISNYTEVLPMQNSLKADQYMPVSKTNSDYFFRIQVRTCQTITAKFCVSYLLHVQGENTG